MKSFFSDINEKLFSSCEVSGIGTIGTMSLLHGRMAKLLNFIGRTLAYTSTRAYGCFLLSFGISALLLNFGAVYFTEQTNVSVSTIVMCAVLTLLSVPLFVFDISMCIALQDFPLTDKLFFDFLLIKRMRRSVKYAGIHPIAALLIGIIPATLSFVFSVEAVLLVIITIIIVTVALNTPEFSMILSFLFVPYLLYLNANGIFFVLLTLVTFISFVFKVILGKRVFHLSLPDATYFLLMLAMLVFGLVSGADSSNVLIICTALLAYFPISNLIVNRRIAECAKKAVVFSAVPIAVTAIVEFAVMKISSSNKEIFAVFDSPAALTAFMLASCAATFVYAAERTHKWQRVVYFSIFILELAVIGVMLRPEAIIVLIIAAIAYPILKSRFIPIDVLTLLLILPYALIFIPDGALDAVSDLFGLSVPLSVKFSSYRSMFLDFFDSVWLGVSSDAPAGANTLFGLALGFGVVALVLFAVLILLRFRHVSYFRLYMRNSVLGTTSDMTELAMITLLLYGTFYNVFSDYAILSLFVAFFGISAAALRTAKREYDDRIGYYDDSNSSESSELDVGVNRYN